VERHRRRLRQIEHAAAVQVHVAEPDDEKILLALQSLSMRQRSALTLRYLDDLSVHEVAIELGCRYQAAESLLARARRSFAAAYEEPS
jgi:RNA polymerase sigma-70 factor (ECF subfamily)